MDNFEKWFDSRVRVYDAQIPNEFYHAVVGFSKFVFYLDLSIAFGYKDFDEKTPIYLVEEMKNFVCAAIFEKFDHYFYDLSKLCALDIIYNLQPMM